MKLEEKEWNFINDLLYKIHLTENISEIQMSFLEIIRFLVPYDMATFYLASTNGKHILSDPVGINISEEKLNKYIEYYEEIDYTRWILLSSKSTVHRETDLISELDREEMVYYKEVYLPDNIYFCSYICLVFNGVFVGIVSLYRFKGKVDFAEKELYVLEQIKDHLALRLYRKNIMADLPYLTSQKNIDLRDYTEKYKLTTRETDVFFLLFNELSDEEICSKLFISLSTLKKHILNIYKKLGVKNRLQLYKLVK